MADKYAWSHDEERYQDEFDTREEALAEGRSTWPEHTIWTGKIDPTPTKRFIPDGGWVIDHMCEQAYDYAGEFAEDWLDCVTKEQRDELTQAIETATLAWLEKHGLTPRFWIVSEVQEHEPATASPGVAE